VVGGGLVVGIGVGQGERGVEVEVIALAVELDGAEGRRADIEANGEEYFVTSEFHML